MSTTTTIIARLEEVVNTRLVRSGKGFKGRASWRGDRHPSLSVFQGADGEWYYRDHGTGESGHVVQILTRHYGYSYQEARRALGLDDDRQPVREKGKGKEPTPDPNPPIPPLRTLEAKEVPLELQMKLGALELPAELKRRGFEEDLLEHFPYVGEEEGNLLIGILGPDETVRQIKVRNKEDSNGRYRYLCQGYGAPALYLGNAEAPVVLIVEGELNALAVWYAMAIHGGDMVRVIGLPGASYTLTDEDARMLTGKAVFIWTDEDPAGRRLREVIDSQIRTWVEGATIYRFLEDNLHRDACEIMAEHGREGLRMNILRRMVAQKRSRRPKVKQVLQKAVGFANEAKAVRDVEYATASQHRFSFSKASMPAWGWSVTNLLKLLKIHRVAPDLAPMLRLVAVLWSAGGARSLYELKRLGAGNSAYQAVHKAVEAGILVGHQRNRRRTEYRLAKDWLPKLKELILAKQKELSEVFVNVLARIREERAKWKAFLTSWRNVLNASHPPKSLDPRRSRKRRGWFAVGKVHRGERHTTPPVGAPNVAAGTLGGAPSMGLAG